MQDRDIDIFEQARPRLLGLAYRLLGSHADAEDALQECFLKWQHTDKASIKSPQAWLTTVCTRHCLDVLKSAYKSRESYIGPWLPEPIQSTIEDEYLATTLSTAFLLMLERLTPKERAAFLLHDVFDQDYADIANTLELTEAGCRQLVSRARQHVKKEKARHSPSQERQAELLNSFMEAIRLGDEKTLSMLLAEDIRLHSDGGGKVPAALRVLSGRDVYLLLAKAREWWSDYTGTYTTLSGRLGLILKMEGIPVQTVTFSFNHDLRIEDIFVTRNPDKLRHLFPVEII